MNQKASAASTILFVDDEANILSSIRRELHDWLSSRSLRLITAPSAKEGMKILESDAAGIAVIVSDLRMPEMKGSDFLLAVKARWPDIVTILLTGFSETDEVMKAVKAGIFSYILKPWDPEYLKSELEKALESRQLKAQNAAYAKTLEEELRWAGEMQRAMLKPAPIKAEGLEFRTSYRPVAGLFCGGDYYDVIGVGPDRFLLLLGDVAGHGVKAALITGILKAIIFPEYVSALPGKRLSPAGFLSWLNDRMSFELRQASGIIITFFAGVLDLSSMSLTYANAGQDHPYIVSSDGKARELPVSGSALGFAHSSMYSDKTEPLSPGDTLVLYTDGLVEAGAREGSGPVLSIKEMLEGVSTGADYHRRLLESALVRSGVEDFSDDVTIVTVRLD